MQKSLLQSSTKKLIIGSTQKQVLSKDEKNFNSLLKMVEKLQNELEQTRLKLDKNLQFYNIHIQPLERKHAGLSAQKTKILFSYYTDRNKILLLSRERAILKEIIIYIMTDYFAYKGMEEDEEMKTIFKVLHGMSYVNAQKEEMDFMKLDLENMFAENGYKMDFSDWKANMNPEELMLKMKEMEAQVIQQALEKKLQEATRKKTKKQVEKEEKQRQVEEAKNKSVSSIYRQLAKIFHPDLEPDPALKLEKEELMKNLTGAYQKNDLYSLLRLELEWITKEKTANGTSKPNLSLYNEMLKEQLKELENDLLMLIELPRYQPLVRMAGNSQKIKNLNMQDEKEDLECLLIDLEESIVLLKSKNAFNVVKSIIKDFVEDGTYDDML